MTRPAPVAELDPEPIRLDPDLYKLAVAVLDMLDGMSTRTVRNVIAGKHRPPTVQVYARRLRLLTDAIEAVAPGVLDRYLQVRDRSDRDREATR